MTGTSSKDSRRAERLRCHFDSIVYCMDQVIEARVADISRTGMCIVLKGWIRAAPGTTVQIRCNELGLIEGSVRWYRAGRMGIHLAETSNTQAQVASYFRHFYRPMPQLKTSVSGKR